MSNKLKKAIGNTYNWLIPNKYPLDTPKRCEELLNEGYTLINNHGYFVFKFKGKQVKSNINRKRDYKFSHPFLWQVVDYSKHTDTTTGIANYNSIIFKIERSCRKLASKWL